MGQQATDSTTQANSVLMNFKNKKCAEKIGDGTAWDGVQLRDCDLSNKNQIFEYRADGKIVNGDINLITWNKDVKMEKNNGYSWTLEGTGTNNKRGGDSVKYGPFKIKSNQWPSGRIGIDGREGSNPNALRYEDDNSADDSQTWISRKLYEECAKLDVNLSDCNLDKIGMDKKCSNKNQVSSNECKDWCGLPENQGKCDTAVQAYCDENQMDKNFCGCYNYPEEIKNIQKIMTEKGTTLLPNCHIKTCASNPSAYVPQSFKRNSCPTQNICLQSFDIGGAAAGDFTGVNFNCSQNVSTNQNSTLSEDIKESTEQGGLNPLVIILPAAAILILIIIMIFLFV